MQFQNIIEFVKTNALKIAGAAVAIAGIYVAVKRFRNGGKRHLRR